MVVGCILAAGCATSLEQTLDKNWLARGISITDALLARRDAAQDAGRWYDHDMLDKWFADVARSQAETWREDLREVLFDSRLVAGRRIYAAFALVGANDRWTFEETVRRLPDSTHPMPTMAAIYILGRMCQREDVPKLIEMLRLPSARVRMCCSWALAGYTFNYLGSPDRGMKSIDLHARWQRWWTENGTKSLSDWHKMGIVARIKDMRSDSPSSSRRAWSVYLIFGLPGAGEAMLADYPTAYLPETWLTWWRDKGSKTPVGCDVESRWPGPSPYPLDLDLAQPTHPSWPDGYFPPLTDFFGEAPFWDGELSFEERRRQDLARWVREIGDPYSVFLDPQTAALRLQMLTGVRFEVRRAEGEDDLDFWGRRRSDLGRLWKEWHDRNAPHLVWDWKRGHFLCADGQNAEPPNPEDDEW
jgi:hypothetical protein